MSLVAPAMLGLSACTALFFHPSRSLVDTPAQHGLASRTVTLRAADGVGLNAWFLPARPREGARVEGTVLFLHGNAENISTHFRSVAWLPAEGFNVLALDYRGYGASEGDPSLAGFQLDIDAAMGSLLSRPDVDPHRIVLIGQSLGAALAIYYAAHGHYRDHLRAVVADSAFSDYEGIVREKMAANWLTWPLQWLPALTVDDAYAPAAAVRGVAPTPLLLIHGAPDAVVPVHHSQELFALARDPKQLWIVPGAGHAQAFGKREIRQRLVDYLDRLLAPDP